MKNSVLGYIATQHLVRLGCSLITEVNIRNKGSQYANPMPTFHTFSPSSCDPFSSFKAIVTLLPCPDTTLTHSAPPGPIPSHPCPISRHDKAPFPGPVSSFGDVRAYLWHRPHAAHALRPPCKAPHVFRAHRIGSLVWACTANAALPRVSANPRHSTPASSLAS